jgi:pyruvate kinase
VQEVYVTADYEAKGNKGLIACSYAKIAEDVEPGCEILCADGSLVLRVEACEPEKRRVRCRAVNTASIGSAAARPRSALAPQLSASAHVLGLR